MDFSFCILLPPLRKKRQENVHILVFRSYWQCLTLRKNRYGQISFVLCIWLYRTKFLFKPQVVLFFWRGCEWSCPQRLVGKATGQHQLYLQMTVAFLQMKESCTERVGWKMPLRYLPEFTSAKLSTVWDLFGEAGKDILHFGRGMAGLERHRVCCLSRSSVSAETEGKRGGCFWEASVILLSSRKRFHCRGSKTSSSQCKTTS